MPAEAFKLQGKLETFTIAGDSGRKKHSKFCPRCGTAVVIEAEGFPDMALIMGGTLDDPSWSSRLWHCSATRPSHGSRSIMR